MPILNALSLTSNVNDWLANSRDPRILHLFDSVCNLVNERREVISVVTLQIGDGPFNLVVEDPICFSNHLRLESEVSASPTHLYLGNLIVHTANAQGWNPIPDWQTLHLQRDAILEQLTKLPITNYLNSTGLDTSFAKTAQGYSTSAQSLLSNLSSALTLADPQSSITAARHLAGLGPGLTPSGDDCIMGALYAVWILHPREVAGVLAQAIADTAASRTTSLSAAWLKAAGRGEAGILWHEFFKALLVSENMRIQRAMDNILAVGETSGADALAGFISTLTYSNSTL